MALTLKAIAEALGISRPRVEMWISRGHFRPPEKPFMLGTPREWDEAEAVRLQVMVDLVRAGLSADQAGSLTQLSPALNTEHGLIPFAVPLVVPGETVFLVAWQGWHEMAGGGKANLPGNWHGENVRAEALTEFLANPDVAFATVININNVIETVTAALRSNGKA